MPTVELTVEQMSHTLQQLTPGEVETLEIMLNPYLKQELKERRNAHEPAAHKGR